MEKQKETTKHEEPEEDEFEIEEILTKPVLKRTRATPRAKKQPVKKFKEPEPIIEEEEEEPEEIPEPVKKPVRKPTKKPVPKQPPKPPPKPTRKKPPPQPSSDEESDESSEDDEPKRPQFSFR